MADNHQNDPLDKQNTARPLRQAFNTGRKTAASVGKATTRKVSRTSCGKKSCAGCFGVVIVFFLSIILIVGITKFVTVAVEGIGEMLGGISASMQVYIEIFDYPPVKELMNDPWFHTLSPEMQNALIEMALLGNRNMLGGRVWGSRSVLVGNFNPNVPFGTEEYFEELMKLIHSHEAPPDNITMDDNGALSIGAYAFHGTNALAMLQRIYNMDPTGMEAIMKQHPAFASYWADIKNGSNNNSWETLTDRNLRGSVPEFINALQKMITSDVGIAGQHAHAKDFIKGNFNTLMNAFGAEGVAKFQENPGVATALVDAMHQWGPGLIEFSDINPLIQDFVKGKVDADGLINNLMNNTRLQQYGTDRRISNAYNTQINGAASMFTPGVSHTEGGGSFGDIDPDIVANLEANGETQELLKYLADNKFGSYELYNTNFDTANQNCSTFVGGVLRDAGAKFPTNTTNCDALALNYGQAVPKDQIQVGDFVLYSSNNKSLSEKLSSIATYGPDNQEFYHTGICVGFYDDGRPQIRHATTNQGITTNDGGLLMQDGGPVVYYDYVMRPNIVINSK